MRTAGTFAQVFEAAKQIAMDVNGAREHSPMNPVIRQTVDGQWMLESGLDTEPDATIEVTLEQFESYFYETMKNDAEITASDVADFVQAMRA